MSHTPRETLLSLNASMLSPPKTPAREQNTNDGSCTSITGHYRRKEVIDGDVVRTYESRYRRRQSSLTNSEGYRQQPSGVTAESRERALQTAMELPSSVLIVQGLRRLLNSDEPLYDDLKKEQRAQLQKEYLKEVGAVEYVCDAQRPKVNSLLSPPASPRGRVFSQKVGVSNEERFCECCRNHCLRSTSNDAF
ncbi:uncharacterized protein PV09_07412 [Verruconis gallopava]|uniref:Uncharacterized protein n=1 Tax=Verruconis gallopava TaxID=253628 RepID=A0A0D2A3V2_9PEZI|nr:uncharacterized protein PV09_07412 [Verruconis gallopava]KIW01125.1 hypothetical protein PV09_07412 [Verruconis gallopava]